MAIRAGQTKKRNHRILNEKSSSPPGDGNVTETPSVLGNHTNARLTTRPKTEEPNDTIDLFMRWARRGLLSHL
jgi:hypothetical protein